MSKIDKLTFFVLGLAALYFGAHFAYYLRHEIYDLVMAMLYYPAALLEWF